MTIETKTTIELGDISTVEFECNACHSKTVWPLSVSKNPPAKCSCSEKEWMTIGGDKYRDLAALISLLQRLAASRGEPFTLRLGLKG